jgi:amino acid adenylation domain-containing protein
LLSWLADSDWATAAPELLPPAQREIRAAVNATEGRLPRQCLHADFFARAAAEPDRPALLFGEQSRTYGQLAEQALRIAAELLAQGVAPGDPVAVTLARGPDQIAAVLGVLAAGAAYVPVGVDQPSARRDRIYAKAGITVAVSEPTQIDGVTLVAPDPAGPGLAEPVQISPDTLAYTIFTSGSTGEPKGVEITHVAAVNTITDINQRYGVSAQDRVLTVSSLDFDLSVYDIFGLLSAGGALVLIGAEDRREARRWAELVHRHHVTIWNSVPALLDMLLVASAEQPPVGLRVVLVSGDWVGLDLPGRLAAAAPHARFVALGGATEAAIWSNACEVIDVPAHWRSIPYGRPLRNQRYRVTDPRGRDCPDWVPGELRIGGAGVALGYRNAPEITAAQFVTDAAGQRWYRTGDLGRYWPDGTLEFLGRVDFQVKLRGHRIELGEIEAAAQAHPGVAGAVALVIGEGSARHIALAAVAGGDGLDERALATLLAERLPGYMVPERIAVLEQLPLTGNGKVDRRVVQQLVAAGAATHEDEPPQGDTEKLLAGLWSELLDDQTIGRHRSFFALGGDSLLATRLLEMLRQRYGLVLTLRQLFAAPTVAQLGAVVDLQVGAPDSADFEEGVI